MGLTDLFRGIKFYFTANHVILKYKLWPYLIIPGIMSVCYLFLMIIFGIIYLSGFAASINETFIPGFLMGGITEIILSIFLWIFLLIIIYISYKEVVLIFFAPILCYLSERVEYLISNKKPPRFNFNDFFIDIFRGLTLSLKNLASMIILTFIAWLVIFVPIIGPFASPILILFIQSFYGGVGLIDYTLERKRYSVKESMIFARSNRGMITGVGAGFILILIIPIFGWFAAPGYGTVAATLAILEKINKN